MHRYVVTGGAGQIGPGTVMSLDAKQFEARAHNLTRLSEQEGRIVARAEALVEFKAGEMLGLTFAPEKALAERFVAVAEEAPRAPPAAKKAAPEPRQQAPRPRKADGGKPSRPTPAKPIGGAAAKA